jgi:hypothetical protein
MGDGGGPFENAKPLGFWFKFLQLTRAQLYIKHRHCRSCLHDVVVVPWTCDNSL